MAKSWQKSECLLCVLIFLNLKSEFLLLNLVSRMHLDKGKFHERERENSHWGIIITIPDIANVPSINPIDVLRIRISSLR